MTSPQEKVDGAPPPDHLLYPPRLVSGVQPTKTIHIGHYVGALRHHIAMHHEYPGECFFMIADYHAMTRGLAPDRIESGTLELATVYLALGLDVNKAVLYRQSDVKEVTELAWILSCVTPVKELQRNPAYKDSLARGFNSTAGLLSYPVLMAADILAVRGTIVPAGPDQQPNVEKIRLVAKRANVELREEVFPIPYLLSIDNNVVAGIDGKKMITEHGNIIPLFARYNELRNQINKIRTSSVERHAPKNPDECLVFRTYTLIAGEESCEALRRRYTDGTVDYAEAKLLLLREIQECFAVYEERYHELKREPDFVWDVLRMGFKQAGEEARETMETVRALVGLAK